MKNESGQILYYRPYPAEAYKKKKSVFSIVLRCIFAIVLILALIVTVGRSEEFNGQRWIICKDYVMIRAWPSRSATEAGQLDPGDEVEIDKQKKKGFAHIVDPVDGWVWAGNLTESPPVEINAYGFVIARKRVACRRWVNGPQIKSNPWAQTGTMIWVFWMSEDWAVTSRGYIQSKWLEIEN
jgi:hypothetical protein